MDERQFFHAYTRFPKASLVDIERCLTDVAIVNEYALTSTVYVGLADEKIRFKYFESHFLLQNQLTNKVSSATHLEM